MPKICMLALEKPHCGVSGVPFMNKTTGAEATALSIAARTSFDSNRAWNGVMNRVGAKARDADAVVRVAARKACINCKSLQTQTNISGSIYRGNCTS